MSALGTLLRKDLLQEWRARGRLGATFAFGLTTMLLFSFGAEGMRYMDPDATLMVHDVSSGAFGKVEEIKADAKEVDRLNKKVYEMMARNCGKPSDYFLKLVHERGHADWYLDGPEAKSHNIANELRVPTLTCKIDLKYTLD